MKLIASLIIIIIIIILFLLSYYKIKYRKTSKSTLIKTISNVPEIFIPSNFDFKSKMSYYFPLGISLRDNSFVTFDASNNKLLCLDEFYSSNNENKTVKLTDCTNDDQQSFSLQRFGGVPKIYNSNRDKCLNYLEFKDKLTFNKCDSTLTDIQKFRIETLDNRISNGNNNDRYLTYDNSRNAILVTNRNTAPRFQHLNFNQECSSDSCTNLTKLNDGYYLFLNTNGVLMLLQEKFDDQTYSKKYDISWSNIEQITPIEDRYMINFDENGNLFIINKKNDKIWSTDRYNKENGYENKIIPYKLEMINNALVVTNGINEIMYTVHPHPQIRNCKLSPLIETLCYNNNFQHRADVINTPLGNGIKCIDMAKTNYNYNFDISKSYIPIYKEFVYRNEKCTDVPFIQVGKFSDDSLYYNNYYYQLVEYNKPYSKKRVIILCYNDYDNLIGIKIQSNNEFYVSETDKLEDILQTLFLDATTMTSETTLTLNNNNNSLLFSVTNLIVTVKLIKNGNVFFYNPVLYKLDNLLKTENISKLKCLDIDNKYIKVIKDNNVLACQVNDTTSSSCLQYDSIEKCKSTTYDSVDDVTYKNVPFNQTYTISNQNVSLTIPQKFIVPRYIHTIHEITYYFTYKIITTTNVTRFSPIYLRLKHNNEIVVDNIELSGTIPSINSERWNRITINRSEFPKILKYRNKELTLELYTSNNNPQNNFTYILSNAYLEIYYRQTYFNVNFKKYCNTSELNNSSHWCNKASIKFDN